MSSFKSAALNKALETPVLAINTPTKAEHLQWGIPHLFDNRLLPVLPFNFELLPQSVAPWIEDVCECMDGALIDFAACALMAALSATIGRKVCIQPKQHTNWLIAANLWGVAIGRPSTKKTPILNEVLKPLKHFEKLARIENEKLLHEYRAEQELAELKTKSNKTKAKDLLKKNKPDDALQLLIYEQFTPEQPVRKRYIVNDSTTPKLGELLSQNPQGLILIRDELSGWLRTLEKEDKGEDRAFYLECWNGTGSFTYDRIERGTIDIDHACLSVFGGIQPSKLIPCLQSQANGTGDDGLIERLQLAVYPDMPKFKFTDRPQNKQAYEKAMKVFEKLDNIPLEEQSIVVKFDLEAQAVFNQWYINLNEVITGDTESYLESHLGKYPALFGKIALILHLCDYSEKQLINKQTAHKAILWCEYLESHARRIYSLANDEFAGSKALFGKLEKLGDKFTVSDFMKNGWKYLTTKEEIHKALKELEDRHIIKGVKLETAGKSKTVYFINPELGIKPQKT